MRFARIASLAASQAREWGPGFTLLVFAVLAVPSLAGSAHAAESLFDVAKVSIDTTAKDAVAAKEKGMAEAEERALRVVLKRLVPLSAYAQLPVLAKDDVSALVTGVSIRSEQYSTTRYIASLDVSFNSQGVKQLLQSYGVGFSEARAPSISLLPIIIGKDSVTSSGAEGWREAWADLDLSHSMTPATIVNPRPDFTVQSANAILAGDKDALASLQSQYGDGPFVIAAGQVADGKFVTRLVGTDSVGELNFSRAQTMQGQSAKAVAREAAEIAFGVLENRWKVMQSDAAAPTEVRQEEGPAPQASPAAPGEVPRNVVALVEFSGLKDWQDIRARLMNVPGLEALEVNSLSARTASITFDYAGSLGRLQSELGGRGFSMDDRDGTFVLRSR